MTFSTTESIIIWIKLGPLELGLFNFYLLVVVPLSYFRDLSSIKIVCLLHTLSVLQTYVSNVFL